MSRQQQCRPTARTVVVTICAVLAVRMANAAQDGVMSMEDCIGYALEHSPDLQKLEISHESQRLQTVIEKAGFTPTITLDNSYAVAGEDLTDSLTVSKEFLNGIELSSTMSVTKDVDDDSDSASLSVSISKQILGGGTILENRNGIDTSIVDEMMALNLVAKKKRELVYRARSYFYQIIRNIQSLSIKERQVESARKNLEHAIERERPLDIITARVEVPEKELAVLSVKRSIADGLDVLKVLIGMPVDQPLTIDEEVEFRIAERDLASDVGFAIENHEDLVNNRLEQRKQEWNVQIKESQVLPDVKLSASFTKENEGTSVNLTGDDEETLGFSISWPFGRAADKAEYMQALSSLRSKQTDYFILDQNKRRRLAQLHRLLEENAESVRLQHQRVELVSRQGELYRDRWENGEIAILEYIRSQNDLEDSKVQLVNLETEYLERLAEYDYEAGR